jgi:hypothetical protein
VKFATLSSIPCRKNSFFDHLNRDIRNMVYAHMDLYPDYTEEAKKWIGLPATCRAARTEITEERMRDIRTRLKLLQADFIETSAYHIRLPAQSSQTTTSTGFKKLLLFIPATLSEQHLTYNTDWSNAFCFAIDTIHLHFTGDPSLPLTESDPDTATYNALHKLECMFSKMGGKKRVLTNNVLVSWDYRRLPKAEKTTEMSVSEVKELEVTNRHREPSCSQCPNPTTLDGIWNIYEPKWKDKASKAFEVDNMWALNEPNRKNRASKVIQAPELSSTESPLILKGKRIFLTEEERGYFRTGKRLFARSMVDYDEAEWPTLIYATNQRYPMGMVSVEGAAGCRHTARALRFLTSRGRTDLRICRNLGEVVEVQYEEDVEDDAEMIELER